MREDVNVLYGKNLIRAAHLVCCLLMLGVLAAQPAFAADEPHGDKHGLEAEHDGEAHHDAAHHDNSDLSHANASSELKMAHSWSKELAIYTFIVFLLLFALLTKFAFKPIAEGLAKREQSIADNIAAAEESAREARELTSSYEAKLAAAADEVRMMVEEARRDADHTRQEIVADARKDAEAERNRAVREINNAKDSALKELATLSANQAVDLAGRVVRSKLTPEEQSALIQTALNDLPNGSPSNN